MMDDETERKLQNYVSKLYSSCHQRPHQRAIKGSAVPASGLSTIKPLVVTTLTNDTFVAPTTPLLNNAGLSSGADIAANTCFAKGMGLVLAFHNRMARFNIYLQTENCLDIVVEIAGPNDDFCTKRITVRSPRRSISPIFDTNNCPDNYNETIEREQDREPINLTTGRSLTIPLEYEVSRGKISVGYMPQSVGPYKLSIIYQGQHITGSPYMINVSEPSSLNEPPSKSESSNNLFAKRNYLDIDSLAPSDTGEILDDNRLHRGYVGKVIRRKVLRSIIYRNGQQVILNGDEPLPPDPRAWMSSEFFGWDEPAAGLTDFGTNSIEDADDQLTVFEDSSFNNNQDPSADEMNGSEPQPSDELASESEFSTFESDERPKLDSPEINRRRRLVDIPWSNSGHNNYNKSLYGKFKKDQRSISCPSPTSQIFLNSNEYEDFWDENNDSIVRLRLKEWETALNESRKKLAAMEIRPMANVGKAPDVDVTIVSKDNVHHRATNT